jgi:hypothetical protein
MKSSIQWFPRLTAGRVFKSLFALGLLPLLGAATNQPAGSSRSATEAATSPPPVPQAVFVQPTKPQEGRDPFFPRSTRPYGSSMVVETNQAAVVATPPVDLRLKGFSGTADHRLAIINNQTFAVGEIAEVTAGNTRLRILCLKINDDNVVIKVGNETRTLHLRSGL